MPDLLKAASGSSEAAKVLEKWDRMTDTDSRGGESFQMWVDRYFPATAEWLRSCASHSTRNTRKIEFGPTQQARCTLGYGNASQPGSMRLEDQLPLMVQKTLHPVRRERKRGRGAPGK